MYTSNDSVTLFFKEYIHMYKAETLCGYEHMNCRYLQQTPENESVPLD